MPTGHYVRERPRIWFSGVCATCGKTFARWWSQTQVQPRFCGMHCAARERARIRARAKVGNDKHVERELWRLYWKEYKSTPAIGKLWDINHKLVHSWMRLFGIPRRKKGQTIHATCQQAGCQEPIGRITHAKNASYYGRRCKRHFNQHRAALRRHYKSSNYEHISEEERWLRKAKETLVQTRRFVRGL